LQSELQYFSDASATEVRNIIEDELQQIRVEVANSSKLQQKMASLGVDLADTNISDFDVRTGSSGLDPGTVALIVAFAATPVHDLWRAVLLPRIKQKWGVTLQESDRDEDA
jgi:hypothetical protein